LNGGLQEQTAEKIKEKELNMQRFVPGSILMLLSASLLSAQPHVPCRNTTYTYAILRYMCNLNDSTIANRANNVFQGFESSLLDDIQTRHPFWKRMNDTLEQVLSKSFRLALNEDDRNRYPVRQLAFPMKSKLDSTGITRLAVFYVYNDNEHSTRKKYVDIIEKPREFEKEDIYYYVSIYDIENNYPIFENRIELKDILKGESPKSPSKAGELFAEKAGLSIDQWGCIETGESKKYRN
jgi:hypothetical protein